MTSCSSSKSKSDTQFTSEGFDLDAVAANSSGGDDDEVIYEIGGGATVVAAKEDEQEKKEEEEKQEKPKPKSPIEIAEEWKQKGNEEFKSQNYLAAYEMYTNAIDECPCPVNPVEVLKQRDAFDANEREKARQRMEDESNRQREQRLKERERRNSNSDSNNDENEKNDSDKRDNNSNKDSNGNSNGNRMETFQLKEKFEFGDKLAIFLNNRSATLIQLERYDDAINDADVAVLLNPRYSKAYLRRSTAYEKLEKTEEALRDVKLALNYDPHNMNVQKNVQRLQKIEDERVEKLKAETMDKLKDLGNSLLGNFGLSLDNFNAVQDPNTGSYSISFNQNK